MDRETLKSLPREEQNRIIQMYLLGGPRYKDYRKEPVYFDNDDDTFKDGTGRIFQAKELDLSRAIVFE